ncbi:MAG: DNA-deoxyinosine glycosylase [Lentisphaerota bacterium]
MNQVRSFKPIIDSGSRVLILGSMPGVKSLEFQQYYAHPQNHFWRIIYGLFDMPCETEYEIKLAFLKSRAIALWDVLESCCRPGSSDSDISNGKVNDFKALFKTFPNIKAVFSNGTKAHETFRKNVGFEILGDRFYRKLPSTSPTHTKKFDQKLKEWTVVLKYLSEKADGL